jgi:hypothetical protein
MAEEMEMEKPSFMDRIRGYFSRNEDEDEQPVYERRLLDNRIEKYLDRHAESYISEFGLLTSIDLERYEERYDDLTKRTGSLQEFARDADATLTNLESRVKTIKAASKKKSK